MNIMCALLLLTVMLQAGASVFEIDLSPGEGVPEFEAASKELKLHELPLGSSRITSTVTVSLNQRLKYDNELYRTLQAGRIQVLEPSTLEGRQIGTVNRLTKSEYYSDKFKSVKLELKLGMTIEYLQYRAEGSCFLRVDGKVIDAFCLPNDERKFHVESKPKTEWWIHVVLGPAVGWIQVSDATVRVVR